MITIMASDLSLKYEITGRRLADVLRKAFLCSLTMLAVVLGFALEGIFAFAARLVVRWRS